MNNQTKQEQVETGRMRTRTAIVLLLLLTLCASIYIPGILEGDTKSLVIGGLLNAFGVAMVFYFKKEE